MKRAPATAKINLALVVGRAGKNGKHEVVSVYQRIGIADRIDVDEADRTVVDGFAGDTLVRAALDELSARAATAKRWRATIEKRVPVAAGLGGGSSDAATALRLANETLDVPLPHERVLGLAAAVGADVPFFLEQGPQLGEGDGSELTALELPQDYWVVLLLPRGAGKESTGAVYAAFDERDGGKGYRNRRAALRRALEEVEKPSDLALLPSNDLTGSPHAELLREHGAFRADVSGAGPVVYGLFQHLETARAARAAGRAGRTWLTAPAWYG